MTGMPKRPVQSRTSLPLAPNQDGCAGNWLEIIRARRRQYGQRNSQLRRLGYTNYAQYLNSAHWAKVKARYRASDLPQACMCGETQVDLHHTTYERIGAELLTDHFNE